MRLLGARVSLMVVPKSLPSGRLISQNPPTIMKKVFLIAFACLTIATNSEFAQGMSANLSFTGPSTWVPGASVTLAVQDTYSGFGAGSYGFSYWFMVTPAVAPFLTITGETTYPPFPIGGGPFPIVFDANGNASAGLGGGNNPPITVPDGSYHTTDLTFALAANAPAGTYTLRTTTASPRGSIQVTSDFGDFPIPQASFVFTVVPEPSTFCLLGLAAVATGIVAYRRRKA